MLACSSLAYALSAARLFPVRPLRSRRQAGKVALLATIFCVTIVLGNASLRFIPVSFSQAVGSGTPFFTAVFAFLLQGALVLCLQALCGCL
jgi:drug/metabolite transporter (DMT)-like permease